MASEATKTVIYRANQNIGYTFLSAALKMDSVAEFYVNVPEIDLYYVSIAYLDGKLMTQYCQDQSYPYRSGEGIPKITVYDNHKSCGIIAVPSMPKDYKDGNMGLY